MKRKNNIDWAKHMARQSAEAGLYAHDRQSDSFYSYEGMGSWSPCEIDSFNLGQNRFLADETLTPDEIVAFEQELKMRTNHWHPLPHDDMIPTFDGVFVRDGYAVTRKRHSPRWHFNYTLPYQKPADCPQFKSMLKASLAEPDLNLLHHYAGDIIWGQNKSNSVLLQLGSDSWTKAVVTKILAGLVGPSNALKKTARSIPSMKQVMVDEMLSHAPVTWILLHASNLPANFFDAETSQKILGLTGTSPLKSGVKCVKRHVVLSMKEAAPMEPSPASAPLSSRTLVIQYNGKGKRTSAQQTAIRLWEEEGEGIVTWALKGGQMLKYSHGFPLTAEHYARQLKLLGIQ